LFSSWVLMPSSTNLFPLLDAIMFVSTWVPLLLHETINLTLVAAATVVLVVTYPSSAKRVIVGGLVFSSLSSHEVVNAIISEKKIKAYRPVILFITEGVFKSHSRLNWVIIIYFFLKLVW